MIKRLVNSVKNALKASVNVASKESTITINGKTYHGNNVSIINDSVYIDGKLQEEASSEKIINIHIQGDAKEVSTISGNVKIEGNVSNNIVSTSGDIEVKGVVGGSVSSVSGDISATDIQGPVSTISGDIN